MAILFAILFDILIYAVKLSSSQYFVLGSLNPYFVLLYYYIGYSFCSPYIEINSFLLYPVLLSAP
ncbi:hypothetical protein BDC45DRAFT_520061 [Circinella umbellata]|nr:hypothetical protein BDC45DRAFT_520061 [Circinella umbellata]